MQNYNNDFQVEFEDFVSFNSSSNEQEVDDISLEFELEQQNVNVLSSMETCPVTNTFRLEDREVIESCSDENLCQLLIANRTKRIYLMQLFKSVKDLVIECRENIRTKSLYISKVTESFPDHSIPNVWRLAAPYFKDQNMYPSPHNRDALLKISSSEKSIYDLAVPIKWTSYECDRLTKAVLFHYNLNRQKVKHKSVISLKAALSKENEDKEARDVLKKNVEVLEQEINDMGRCTEDEVPPLNSDQYIDWFRISDYFLRGRHTPLECRAFWNIYLHPHINRSDWTDEENVKITELAKTYKQQNWDKIAEELDTGRTGFLTCVHYSSILCDKYSKEKFTLEEDKLIMEVVGKSKIGDVIVWSEVAKNFSDRSRTQLYHRYTYFLMEAKPQINRDKFTDAEDILLLALVHKFGKNFKKCAEHFPHRTYMQLKNRFNTNLENDIKKGYWSAEDDRIILKFVEQNGTKKWSDLTRVLKRSRGQLRQRYMTLIKFLPNWRKDNDVSKVPRKKHPMFKKEEGHYEFIKYMAEKYKNIDTIPTLEDIQNCLLCKESSSSRQVSKALWEIKSMDSLLQDFIGKFEINRPQQQDMKITGYKTAINDISLSLNNLVVSLNLPECLPADSHLDEIDLEILKCLRSRHSHSHLRSSQVCYFIPPNVSTLSGLRCVLINNKSYRNAKKKNKIIDFLPSNQGKSDNELLWSIEHTLAKLDDNTRERIISERDMFIERFKSLFYWPALLSEETPPKIPNEVRESETMDYSSESPVVMSVKRTLPKMQDGTSKRRRVYYNVKTETSI